ncbi:MAG TPA: molybdate ABC transporter substrate-binding protein [Chloroflexaceae bacterium]|nr:molybdate ABC transporter substrate-binding protein [Chloroflexaceae bacterium]
MARSRQALGLEHAILGFLRAQPAHGYEVYQRLIAPTALGTVWPLKQSQFYALVARLEAEGYLTVAAEPRGSLPPRKLLRLTPAGEAAFASWLRAGHAPGDEQQRAFLARLYFIQQLDPGAVQQLLDTQRQQVRARLHTLRHEAKEHVPPHSFPWQVRQWHIRQAEATLDWLDTFAPPVMHGITYRIAVIRDSPARRLAEQFVAFACGPEGQAMLARAGFLPAGDTLAVAEPAAPLQGRLTVYAAASLTAAFEVIRDAFVAAHPRAAVELHFDGSHTLAGAVAQGAAADVYAPAHADALAAVIAAGRVSADAVRTLGHNQLAIVTPSQRHTPLHTLRDLARPGLRIAMGSRATAIGRYTLTVLRAAEQQGVLGSAGAQAVLDNVVHYAETVTGVLTTVARGEVDAGIVFTSDYHRADGDVQVAVVPALR